MFAQILAEAAQSEKVLIWTLVLTSGGTFAASVGALIKYQLDRKNDRADKEAADAQALKMREQDRLDAKLKAELILQEGARREGRIVKKIDENSEISRKAFDAANGHNEKIETAMNKVARVSEVIATASEAFASKADGG